MKPNPDLTVKAEDCIDLTDYVYVHKMHLENMQWQLSEANADTKHHVELWSSVCRERDALTARCAALEAELQKFATGEICEKCSLELFGLQSAPLARNEQ